MVPRLLKRISVIAGFSLLAGLLILSGIITTNRLHVQRNKEEWVAHTRQVLIELEDTESTLKDAETGQRGYLLTGDRRYLTPYDRAASEIGPRIDSLARLTADNPVQQRNIALLRNLASERMAELAQTINLYRSGDEAGAKAAVESDVGLLVMDRLRLVFADMEEEEVQLEGQRSAVYQQSLRSTMTSLWLATLAALLGLVALAWFIVRERAMREKHAQELRASEEWFRTTLTSIGDAVIATDRSGNVTFLNPVAEKLTGRGSSAAAGKPIQQVFPIFNEETGDLVVNPVEKVIEQGTVVGLANHTVLERSDGARVPIDDSAAPIHNQRGELIGVVLVFRDVTERRRAEDESRLLASIVASSDDAIISKDMNGIVTSWNRGASAIFGYSAEEMIGRPISDLSPPDRQSEMPQILDRIGHGEHIDHFPSIERRKDGKLIHVSISVSPLRDANGKITGASKIVSDITAQVEAQRAAALQREWLQVTLKSIGDAVVTTDTAGAVSFLNPVAEQLTGWSLEDAAGRPLPEVMRIVNEDSRRPVENPVTKVLREGKVVGLANHTVLIARNGREVAIDDSAAPIRDDHGELIGVVLVFRDVTAERKTQEVLRKTDKLAAAARLSATVAHEINNPLAAVVNLIFIARSTPGTPDSVVRMLLQADQELERVAHITRQTLGFYRESSAPGPVEIAALVESALKLYANKLEAKDIQVECAFENCAPVHGVLGELRQVISNLIANAIDAVDRGGRIVVSAHPVSSGKNNMIEIVVADDGPGVASEHIGRIFEPFFTTKKDVGTGLGLWAAKTIVERHGGSISVNARQEANGSRGAAFVIRLVGMPALATENNAGPVQLSAKSNGRELREDLPV